MVSVIALVTVTVCACCLFAAALLTLLVVVDFFFTLLLVCKDIDDTSFDGMVCSSSSVSIDFSSSFFSISSVIVDSFAGSCTGIATASAGFCISVVGICADSFGVVTCSLVS